MSGREMITLFLDKPSRKDYPDYYKLVLEPIDMKTIEKKIKQDKYISVEDMIDDFKLMFNNARHYNEPGSQVSKTILLSSCSGGGRATTYSDASVV